MEYSIQLGTMKIGWSIVYIVGVVNYNFEKFVYICSLKAYSNEMTILSGSSLFAEVTVSMTLIINQTRKKTGY